MKRISFFLFAMLISSMSLFTACSDDDDDTASSEMVAGTYNGTLVATLAGNEVANESKSLSLVKNGDDAIDVVIKDFKLNVSLDGGVNIIPVSLGDLKVEKCTLTQKDGKYTFSGSKELKDIEVPLGPGDPTPVDCTVNIVNATVEGNNLNLPIVVGVMGGVLTVNVQYTGTK